MFIFYIDDDPDDRDIFLDALEAIRLPTHCITARDGQEALKLLQEGFIQPDVIFLDVNMPVMDGWEFMRALKMNRQLENIPVIIYSTNTSEKDNAEFKKLGARMCLKKQAGYKKLCHELGSILRSFQ